MKIKYILLVLFLASCSTSVKQPENIYSDIEIEVIDSHYKYFTTKSTLKWIKNVVTVANCIANNKNFLNKVESIQEFDFSKDNGLDVRIMLNVKKNVYLKSKWYFSKKVKAWTNKNSNFIFYNTRSNPRAINAMINTAFHERLHFLGYEHGNNYNQDKKKKSVNHGVGILAESYVNVCINQ